MKAKDKVKFSVDYSRATFKDKDEKIVCRPLPERDNIIARFVNVKTAIETTQDPRFETIQNDRLKAVEEKYAGLESVFAAEKEKALAEAKAEQDAKAPEVGAKKAEMNAKNSELKAQLAEAKEKYKVEMKEIKARHKEIYKTEMAKIDAMYKKMWEDEKADYKKCMLANKDHDTRQQRRIAYSIFRENFPQMKANDVERKTNSLEFDKETEINGSKARYNQQKHLVKETIKESNDKFRKENYPYNVKVEEYKAKEKELQAKKADDELHAKLIFFFTYEKIFQLIPDDINSRIIQGLGNRVFTKNFRVEVPHNAFKEEEGGIEFKVTANINYGDMKMYKCVGELYGEKLVIYIEKTRELELGSKLELVPDLDKCQIYEDELNIRLY